MNPIQVPAPIWVGVLLLAVMGAVAFAVHRHPEPIRTATIIQAAAAVAALVLLTLMALAGG